MSICAQEQRKLALVIGNANYEDPNAVLLNPINDSRLMTETFKELEFDSVIVANDLTFDAMREVFKNYRNSLNRFDVGFIYYSGHGMQDAYNETYLIPIDFPENSTIDDVTDYGYSIQDVLKSLNRYGDKLNVFVLDACRDNPYERGWKGRSLKGGGLSEPQVPPTGSLVAYSTSPGDVASDGDVGSTNSVYTKALAEILKEPNLKIEEVFKRVRNVVYSGSNQNQNPQWWGQLEGDLYLLLEEDTKVISLEAKLKYAFEELYKYESYLDGLPMGILHLDDSNNIGNIDIIESFNSVAKYTKGKEKDMYILSLFGITKVGLFASYELTGNENIQDAQGEYITNLTTQACYDLYRVIAKESDHELEKILDHDFIKMSAKEFRTRVVLGYIYHTSVDQGEIDSFDYEEFRKVISDLDCQKADLNGSQALLFSHMLSIYIEAGWIEGDDLICSEKSTQKEMEIFNYLFNISSNLEETVINDIKLIPALHQQFKEYFTLFTSNKLTNQINFDTSYGYYFCSFDRALVHQLKDYATQLNQIDYGVIHTLEDSEKKSQLLLFLGEEIDNINNIGHEVSKLYFDEFKRANSNNEPYENQLYTDLFTEIADLNNNFRQTNYKYQYQNLFFKKVLASHFNTLISCMETLTKYYSEDRMNEIVDYYTAFEIEHLMGVYVASHSSDKYFDLPGVWPEEEYDLKNLRQDSKTRIDEYYYQTIESNKRKDTINVEQTIDYIYYKTRWCDFENVGNMGEQFKCYANLACVIFDLENSLQYTPEFYDDDVVDHFWNAYSTQHVLCDSTLSSNELYNCHEENAYLESQKELDLIKYYEEGYNGLGNFACNDALGRLINVQLDYLSLDENFISKMNGYILKYTDSFVALTTLRSGLAGQEYFNYTMITLNKYFDDMIVEIIDSDKINDCNKQLIIEGVLYNLQLFIEDFAFSELHKPIRDILQYRIDVTQVTLNHKLDVQHEENMKLITRATELLSKHENIFNDAEYVIQKEKIMNLEILD